MKYLGIDYGRKKIGLAISEGKLAEPYKVLKVNDVEDAKMKVLKEAKQLNAEILVVGITEAEMGQEQERFAQSVGAMTFDETLSTHDAQIYSLEVGINRKKRKDMEDAYAASIMLQNYIDSIEEGRIG